MHKSLLAGILVAALAFSGCTGADDRDPSDLYPDDPSGAGTEDLDGEHATPRADEEEPEDEEGSTGAVNNTPPSATISAAIQTGEIPFNVTFDLSGADADGDALSWGLDADGDGTVDAQGDALPAQHVHQYASEGLFTARFTVTDGNHTTEQSLIINATAAAAGEEGATMQAVNLEWTAGACYVYLADAMAGYNLAGIAYGHFEVEPGTIGQPFSVAYTGPDAWILWGISFLNDAGDELDFHESVLAAYELSGTVPEGATHVVVYTCPGAAETAEYVAGPA